MLAGLTAFEWVLVCSYAVGIALIVEARRARPPAASLGGLLVFPLLAGITVLAFLAVKHPEESRLALRHVGSRASAVGIGIAALLVALAVVDVALARVAPALASLSGRVFGQAGWVRDASLALVVALLASAVVIGGPKVSRSVGAEGAVPAFASTATVVASYSLPGHPADIVSTGKSEGYISYGEGDIVQFSFIDGVTAKPTLRTVARDLEWPRGLAVIGNTLFVTELGPLPCPDPFPRCKGGDVPDLARLAAEREILRTSRGRISAFDIGPEGGLANKRTIVSGLPFGNTDHGVNDIIAGPDGFLFVSIGNLDALYGEPEIAARVGHPNVDYLGTVLKVSTHGRRPEVIARGLRNVYGLTLDDRGRLYGVDNDGPTVHGQKREEVLWLRQGADFGYPYEGTFGSHRRRTDEPVWILDSKGSAGIEWGPNLGLAPGLVIGSCGKLERLSLTRFGGEELVAEGGDASVLLEVPGCITAVEPGPEGTTFLTVFPFGESPALYVLRIDDES
jgi:hypothetical protein